MVHNKLDEFVIHWSLSADTQPMLCDIMERIFCMILLDSASIATASAVIGPFIDPPDYPPRMYGSATIYLRHYLVKRRFNEGNDFYFQSEENLIKEFGQALFIHNQKVSRDTGPTVAITQENTAKECVMSSLYKTICNTQKKITQSALSIFTLTE